MTTRIDLEWDTQNLRRTAEQFLLTPGAKHPVGVEGPLTTAEEAEAFLLGKLERVFSVFDIPAKFKDLHCDYFNVYKSVWVGVVFSNSTLHCGNDRVAGLLREYDVLPRQDAGLLGTRTIDLQNNETAVLLAQVSFLTKL